MDINSKKVEYINQKILSLIPLVSTIEHKKSNSNFGGSFSQKPATDITQFLVNTPMIVSSNDFDGNITYMRQLDKNKEVGFLQKDYPEFEKFTMIIYNEKSVGSLVSKNFIRKKTFSWILKAYNNEIDSKDFWDYFLIEMREAIVDNNIFFPLLQLELKAEFFIGEVKFCFFSEKQLELSLKDLEKENSSRLKEYSDFYEKQLLGQVFARYTVKAEKEKAQEIAAKECALALDVLKICSPTLIYPNMKMYFDIDFRAFYKQGHKIIWQNPNVFHDIAMNFESNNIPFFIDEITWELLNSLNLAFFHRFLLEYKEFDTELYKMVINAIQSFSRSLSNHDLHVRIVEIFTVFEMLLLPNENSSIIDSVCKYGSKLAAKTVEERIDVINNIKKMYGVRSAMIHHAKRKYFKLEDLKLLQLALISIIHNLILKLKIHETKKSLLEEIDIEILKAY